MHAQGTGQYIVTHDDTRVDLFIVVVRITLFTVNFKSTTLMMRAHTRGAIVEIFTALTSYVMSSI